MVTRRDCSAITKKTRYRWNPTSVSTSTVNRSQAVRPSQGACMPVVVPDPLHRGPSDLVAEVRERPADPCVPPHWGFSTAIRTTSAATSRRVIGRPRPRAQVLLADPILLPEIRDQIVLVAGHPASERENEEL